MNVLVQHIPHAIPVVVIWGLLLRFWLAQRRLERADNAMAGVPAAGRAPAPAVSVSASGPVRRSVALRGLLALGPLIGALATGMVIYALNLGQGRAGAAAVWTHVGISLLALLLVVYKVAEIGLVRLRESVSRPQVWRSAGSLALLVLWVPLIVSGVLLLIFPSEVSFTAYAHLIAGVWWTGLLLWHLRRYLARATRAVFGRPAASPAMAAASAAGPARGPVVRTPAGGHGSRTRSRAARPGGVQRPGAVSPTGESEADGGAAAPIGRG